MSKKLLSGVASFMLILSLLVVGAKPVQALDWSTDIRLTEDLQWDASPSITHTSDGKIWVVWTSARTGNNEIFYKIFDGSTWSNETQLTRDPDRDVSPSVMQAADGKIWVVWSTNRGLLDNDIYYNVFDGDVWSGDTQLFAEVGEDNCPAIAQTADGKIWVVWSSYHETRFDAEIFYKVLDGASWFSDVRLTFDSNRDDEDPCIMQAKDGRVWVVYSKTAQATGKTGDIFYQTFDGSSWSGEIQLTSHLQNDLHPTIMQSANERIWVTWESDRDGVNNTNIYYKVFDGASWTADTKLTSAMERDNTPSITQGADASIWIVWASQRIQDQLDLYYRKGMELHDIAVLSASYYASHETVAFRGEKVYVEVGVQNNGEAKEVNVQVRCYANSSLIESRVTSLAFGQYYSMVFEWNTPPKAAPGMYVIRAEVVPVLGEANVRDNSLVGNAVEVRIIGDIVGMYGEEILPIPDRRVDIDDFSIPIIHFGCTGPDWAHPTWDPIADVTENLIVDLDDMMTVGVHFGET